MRNEAHPGGCASSDDPVQRSSSLRSPSTGSSPGTGRAAVGTGAVTGSAAAGVPKVLRQDPGAVADHVLRAVLPDGAGRIGSTEDVALLAARFD